MLNKFCFNKVIGKLNISYACEFCRLNSIFYCICFIIVYVFKIFRKDLDTYIKRILGCVIESCVFDVIFFFSFFSQNDNLEYEE